MTDPSNFAAPLPRELASEQDGFYTDLADALHAMAQPLTILRSAIAMLASANESETQRHRCTDISARQIERVCNLFASLQNLVASRLEPADSAPMDLQELLARTVEGQVDAFRERGVEIEVEFGDPLPPALGDARRTEEAIATLLEVALSASAQGDRVEILVRREGDFAEVLVACAQDQGRSLNTGELVNLSVVKANLLSQCGRFRFSAEPLLAMLALPVCECASQNAQAPSEAHAN